MKKYNNNDEKKTPQAKFECKINIGSEIPAHAIRQLRYGHWWELAKKDAKVVKAQTKKFIFPFVHRKGGGLTIAQVFLKSVTSSQKISKASLKCKKKIRSWSDEDQITVESWMKAIDANYPNLKLLTWL